MFNILKLLFLLLTTITFNAFGFDSNEEKMEFCKSITEVIQKQLPMKVDQVTTLNSVICSPTNPPTFIYDFIFGVDSTGDLAKEVKDSVATNSKKQLNIWCSSPDKKMIIDDFKVQIDTKDINGVFLDSLKLDINNCKK